MDLFSKRKLIFIKSCFHRRRSLFRFFLGINGGLLLSLFIWEKCCKQAHKAGVSVQAWLWLKLVRLFSPIKEKDLRSIIALKRLMGPSGFWRFLRGNTTFRKEYIDHIPVYVTCPKAGAATSLHILYLHGGAFVMAALPYYGWMLPSLARRLSCTVDMPIYPLAPEHDWHDTTAAVLIVYEELARRHGPENIVLMGDSAGGQLAVTLARELVRRRQPLPRCLVLFSPFLDLFCSGEDQKLLEKKDPLLTIPFLKASAHLWTKNIPVTDLRVNPLLDNLEGLPPIILFTGTHDILNSDARRLKKKEPWVVLNQYHGMPHIWMVCGWLPEAHRALDEASAFIRHPVRAGAPALDKNFALKADTAQNQGGIAFNKAAGQEQSGEGAAKSLTSSSAVLFEAKKTPEQEMPEADADTAHGLKSGEKGPQPESEKPAKKTKTSSAKPKAKTKAKTAKTSKKSQSSEKPKSERKAKTSASDKKTSKKAEKTEKSAKKKKAPAKTKKISKGKKESEEGTI